jgi:Tetratricopeptide repeat
MIPDVRACSMPTRITLPTGQPHKNARALVPIQTSPQNDGALLTLERASEFARRQLAELLREQGNLDEALAVLRRAADAGDRYATEQLAELLSEQGNLDEFLATREDLA